MTINTQRRLRPRPPWTVLVLFLLLVSNLLLLLHVVNPADDACATSMVQPSLHQVHTGNSLDVTFVLAHQVRLQNEFQSLLRRNQFPSDCQGARVWQTPVRKRALDGFCLEFQDMARHLLGAIATQRRLVPHSTWQSAYCPTKLNSWTCLWEPLTNCTTNTRSTTTTSSTFKPPHYNTRHGISSHRSDFFDTYYYGNTPVIVADKGLWYNPTANVDRLPYWETAMGRFWIRAQLAHFLFQPNAWLRKEITRNVQSLSPLHNESYIGMHIRWTDSADSLQQHFGRNASVTRTWNRFLEMAETIRKQSTSTTTSTTRTTTALRPLSTLYVATDSQFIHDEIQHWRLHHPNSSQWTIVLQHGVVRSNAREFMWFRHARATGAGPMATDLELLRRAVFLIGSYQSNVFRLATALNEAFHVDKVPRFQQRFYSLDVEWYEDP